MVPDCGHGGWGHPLHHESLLYVVIDLCAKFPHSSMIVSRISRPQSPCSEDIDGS